ncbi:MAG: EamA family transporter [Myxococcota bacterium]|nr:DMT family transporter [Myxococcota bacterium]
MGSTNWLVLLATVSWGIWAFALRMAMNTMGPLSVQIVYAIAGVALVPAYWALARYWKEPLTYPLAGSAWATAAAVLVGIGIVALLYAMRSGPSSSAVALTATYPAVTLVLAVLFLGESITLTRVAGVAAIAVGAYLVSR